jgi:hypothetical protein
MVNYINQQVQEAVSWEELISSGMVAREDRDNSQWLLGDLAKEVEKGYGEDTVGKYAGEIGIVKKTLMNYRTVSTRFSPEIRKKYRKLSFSHFSTVASMEEPVAWLEQADDNGWSIEMLKRELHLASNKGMELKDDPPQVYKCPECGKWRLKDISTFEICRGHYNINEGKYEYT